MLHNYYKYSDIIWYPAPIHSTTVPLSCEGPEYIVAPNSCILIWRSIDPLFCGIKIQNLFQLVLCKTFIPIGAPSWIFLSQWTWHKQGFLSINKIYHAFSFVFPIGPNAVGRVSYRARPLLTRWFWPQATLFAWPWKKADRWWWCLILGLIGR
jgi:hypothetical protein